MQLRPLGDTGLSVSILGYGAFKIGRNRQHRYPNEFVLPSEAESERILNAVLDAGITLIDTAPAYGLSEERIGRGIGHRREEFVLATKVGETWSENGSRFDFSAAAIRDGVEQSLRRLRTDRLDLVCVHSDGNDRDVLNQNGVVDTLRELQLSGLIRAVGFSAKTPAGAREALRQVDVLMLTFNPRDTSQAAVIAAAHASGKGVLVKKGLASGRLAAESAIPFVLSEPGVSSLLISTLDCERLRRDIEIAESI